MSLDKKTHWEHIYTSKNLEEVSWYEPTPQTSLDFLERFAIAKDAAIIDIGGGDSLLIDYLLALGYSNVTVLDISENALARAKKRLGELAESAQWIVADAATFKPTQQYDFWHDRAAFHFLTDENDINHYITTIKNHIKPNGYFVIGTFSENGPTKCSGIPIRQYNENALSEKVQQFFKKIKCFTFDHTTPFNTVQNFIFCSFQRFAV